MHTISMNVCMCVCVHEAVGVGVAEMLRVNGCWSWPTLDSSHRHSHFGVDGLRRGDVAYLILDDAVTDEAEFGMSVSC